MKSRRSGLICTRTGELVSEFVILALPFEATQKLLPHLPAEEGAEKLARQIERHEHWPICSVHLWFDREITEPRTRRAAGPRDSLDVQPVEAASRARRALHRIGGQRHAVLCGAAA